ncbi:MAG: glycosyl hydrolase family 18 protein [Tissierellaceae bacterium]|nr:glycosyl hydrolase family 18 protein [Tissierellaceae bacterium]
MKKIFLSLLVLIVVIGLIGGGIYIFKYKPSEEVIIFSDEMYLMIEDVLIEDGEPAIFEDNQLYFSFDIIKTYFDEDVYYDEAEELLIFTNNDRVKRYKIDAYEGSANSKEYLIDYPVKLIDNKVYVPLDLFQDDYEIDVQYYDETNAVVVDYTDVYYLNGEIVLNGASIRTDLDIKSPKLLDDIEISTILYIYGEFEDWYKVRTLDGIPGFIEKKYVKVNHTKDIYKTELLDRNEFLNEDIAKINLTWDYTYRKLANTDNIKQISGVNVMSPTWFSITDENRTIYDKGNRDYVSKYGNLGYEIWPLIDNSFDPDLTHNLLKSSENREKLIDDILDIYLDYGFQGINIDFENIHLKDKDLLTQFVRELYPVFKENGLIVSMAVSPLSTSENWSLSFDRERLSKTTDYLMLMAYDQHWAASPIAGSVAQYSWVERSIEGVLEFIPNNKLILAVPYYTRLWIEEDGKVSSQALSMDTANKFIYENDVELTWDDESMQYYGEIGKDGKTYKIWLEDSNSLKYKASLINKYSLAGVASWRKGFETEDVWETIATVVN